jgi:hypothetical protein
LQAAISGTDHFVENIIDIPTCWHSKSDDDAASQVSSPLPAVIPTLSECGGVEIEIDSLIRRLIGCAGVMPTRSRAPNPSVWNLHTKPAVEGNRCIEIAANEVYLVEGWLAHVSIPFELHGRIQR